ncbi:MAG: hypothetical protein JWN71_3229 [Xanthobacteraceae bacterium]|nr:hypothetical protein [Xanthobacteraceae bacterium]
MTDDAIVQFPVHTHKRILNQRGKFSVSCIVSGRWLRFENKATKIHEGTAVFFNVMTYNGEGDRKLCEMCVTLEDLRALLNQYDESNDSK